MFKQEFDSLVPGRDFSRRDFVRTTVGSGFAAAVLPVSAQTIKTDSTGLVAGEVMVPVGDFKMPAYRAAPAGKANAPVVLVISEIFGVHEHIADVARRFAKAGYYAIAPELFVRQGDASSYGEIGKLIAEVISKVPDAQVMADLDATVAWAKGEGADTRKLPNFDDQDFAMELLETEHVLVAPGSSFNVDYRNYFRVTILPQAKVIDDVFRRIEKVLRDQ